MWIYPPLAWPGLLSRSQIQDDWLLNPLRNQPKPYEAGPSFCFHCILTPEKNSPGRENNLPLAISSKSRQLPFHQMVAEQWSRISTFLISRELRRSSLLSISFLVEMVAGRNYESVSCIYASSYLELQSGCTLVWDFIDMKGR